MSLKEGVLSFNDMLCIIISSILLMGKLRYEEEST